MCLTPQILPGVGPVACRFCDLCRQNRVNDLVGRCIAEAGTASKTYAVTLTYRDDVPNAAVLVYRDVQSFLKRLRKKYDVRYIVAGEYGTKKGRAHWHIILFFYGKFPDIDIDKRFDWSFWPHGFSYFQEPDYGGFYYILKYCLKDYSSSVRQNHIAMSKKPPLGHEFFQRLAVDYVRDGLSPQSFEYSFANIKNAKGFPRRYFIQGKTRQNFLARYLAEWEFKHDRPYPFSDLLETYEDALVSDDMEYQNELADWHRKKEAACREKLSHLFAARAQSDLTPIVADKLVCEYEDEYGIVPFQVTIHNLGPIVVDIFHDKGRVEKWHDASADRALALVNRSRVLHRAGLSAKQLADQQYQEARDLTAQLRGGAKSSGGGA